MLKILNHVHKYKDDKDKLLNLCVRYIHMVEKLTDIDKLQENTIEERRISFLLKPLLLSLRYLAHPNFPLEEVMQKEAGRIDVVLRLLLRRALTLYRQELTCSDDVVSILVLTHVLSQNCTSNSQPIRRLTEKATKTLKGQADMCMQARDMEGDWKRIAIAVESTAKNDFICDAYSKLSKYSMS